MKRTFLVLILMFTAGPAANAEQASSCPCFNDLQIAGTCARATTVVYTAGDGGTWGRLYCSADPATTTEITWVYRVDYAPPTHDKCTIGMEFGAAAPGRVPDRFTVREARITRDQLADCFDQMESAAEMLN